MASNIERLTITDTFTNWRDKINALMDVTVLAPMADEDGVMHIDVPHCNTRLVKFDVPVEFTSDFQADSINCSGTFTSSATVTTIQETMDAGLKIVGDEEGYVPWVSGRTRNGMASLWTSTFDNSIHFAYVNVEGELVNTFSWDPATNLISARIENADRAETATTAETLQINDFSDEDVPGSYPVMFGSIADGSASGAWDEGFTYSPRDGVLTANGFKGSLDGNAKTASSAAKLTTKRRITLGTDAEGYVDFDGSKNVTLPCSLVSTGVTPNLYGPSGNVNVPRTNRRFVVPSFRVDAKGRITQAFTRTVEFPFPEVDVDTEFSSSSRNPVENRVLTEKFSEIDAMFEQTPGMDVATPTSPGLMSAADKTKLNSLTQNPRINSISAQTCNASTGVVARTETRTLSTSNPTRLTVKAGNGLTGALNVSEGTSLSTVTLTLGMQIGTMAGSGLVESNGKLTVPSYSGATSSSAGTAGLVPPATSAQRGMFLNGAGEWVEPAGTTYSNSSSSTAGLMSAADKTKLDGIAAQATKVAFTRILTSGTKIGTININGTATDIYAEKNTDTTYSTFGAATASQAGTNGLVPAPPKGAQSKFLRGDKSWIAVYDSGQIDSKIAEKASLASPVFTGVPKVPDANAGTSTQQAANTAFVMNAVNDLKGADCPAGLDTLAEIAASIGNSVNFKKDVNDALAMKLSTTSAGYVKNVSLNGRTLIITTGDGNSSSFTTVDTNTTYPAFVKSGSSAAAGLVPKPPTTAGSTKYLCENGTWAAPAMNSDVNVTNTLNTTAKAYITGTTSASTNTGTQVFDTGVFLTTTAGTLQATTFVGALNGTAEKAKTLAVARTINGVSFDGSKNITVADSTKLPLTGGTLTGNLVIAKSKPVLATRNTAMTRGIQPGNAVNTVEILGQDSEGKSTWGIYHQYDADMGNLARLICYKGTTNDNTWSGLGIGYDKNGNAYTIAPTPAAADNSTKIATTAWARTATGNFACNAATATKVGTATVGGTKQPVYIKAGAPTALTDDVGSTSNPVYLKAGVLTACDGNIMSSDNSMVPSSNPIEISNNTEYTASTNGFLKIEANWDGIVASRARPGAWNCKVIINGHETNVTLAWTSGRYADYAYDTYTDMLVKQEWRFSNGCAFFAPVRKGWTYRVIGATWCAFQACG